jgi:F-type H+-transporting ATPase subunit gamma
MQRTEQNINELIGSLTLSYNRQRQAAMDEELFDLIAGYEVLGAQGAAQNPTESCSRWQNL